MRYYRPRRPRPYRPRRATKARWLEGAPDYVLACYDHPDFNDRYTVYLTGEFLHTNGAYTCTWVSYIGVSQDGGTYFGQSPAYETANFREANYHRMIAWKDLPEKVRKAVIARCTEDDKNEAG